MFYWIKLQLPGLRIFSLSTFHTRIKILAVDQSLRLPHDTESLPIQACPTGLKYIRLLVSPLLDFEGGGVCLVSVGGAVPHKKRQSVFSYFLHSSFLKESATFYALISVYFRFPVPSQWPVWCLFTNLVGENSYCTTWNTGAFFCPLPFIPVRLSPPWQWLKPIHSTCKVRYFLHSYAGTLPSLAS